MFNCHDDVLAYHDEEVTLPKEDQDEMRQRRNANRTRLKKGLEKNKKPLPIESRSQGSYAMKTMVQHPEKDYDIDDGSYFEATELVGPKGGEMSSLDARQMVRDAVDDGKFKTPPEVRLNCVRVLYDVGYHVDIPVYRRVVVIDVFGKEHVHYELASASWKRSDARDVTAWFDKENLNQSPDDTNGRQMRRICRYIKKFARSRPSWAGLILSGFGITKLASECYRKDGSRDDQALHDTMKAIRDRLKYNLVVAHPVTPGDTITKGDADPKAKFLREKLSDAIRWLEPLHEEGCTRQKALKCWDDVFNCKFFSERNEAGTKSAASSVLTSGLYRNLAAGSPPSIVQKDGGGRYA